MLYNIFAKAYIANDEILNERFETYMSENFPDIEEQGDFEGFLRFFGVYLLLDQYRAEYGLYDASTKLLSLR